MADKNLIRLQNLTLIDSLIQQKVVGHNRVPLSIDFKRLIAEDLVKKFNDKPIPDNYRLQDAYNQSKSYYNHIFEEGVQGHAYFPEVIYHHIHKENYDVYINENGNIRKSSADEVAYKMEHISVDFAANSYVAFTKFKPKYRANFKGGVDIIVTIPSLKEIRDMDMTVEEVVDYLDEKGVEVVLSDPKSIRGKKNKEAWTRAAAMRVKKLKWYKSKHYKKWKGKE